MDPEFQGVGLPHRKCGVEEDVELLFTWDAFIPPTKDSPLALRVSAWPQHPSHARRTHASPEVGGAAKREDEDIYTTQTCSESIDDTLYHAPL